MSFKELCEALGVAAICVIAMVITVVLLNLVFSDAEAGKTNADIITALDELEASINSELDKLDAAIDRFGKSLDEIDEKTERMHEDVKELLRRAQEQE